MYFASHSAIAPFALHEPGTAHEAVALLTAHPGAAFLAGGGELLPLMRAGTTISDLIALQRVDGLHALADDDQGLTIGGGVTFDQLLSNEVVATQFPDFMRFAAEIGNIRVRCAATLGGNLASQNAGYDLLPLLLAADASVRVATAGGETPWPTHGAGQPGFVDWAPDGLIDRIIVPRHDRAALRFERRFKPVASVALGLWQQDDQLKGRLAVGCAFDRIWTATLPGDAGPFAEVSRNAASLAAHLTADLPTPADDTLASGGYRKRLIETIVRRQLESVTG